MQSKVRTQPHAELDQYREEPEALGTVLNDAEARVATTMKYTANGTSAMIVIQHRIIRSARREHSFTDCTAASLLGCELDAQEFHLRL